MSLCCTTTDGEFFPLCALLSIYAKALLSGARWNHHQDESALEEGCCRGAPGYQGSQHTGRLREQSQLTTAGSDMSANPSAHPQNPSCLHGSRNGALGEGHASPVGNV